jgi:phosphatidylglycerol lysyltransferase
MYGIAGGSAVAMGDPVGPIETREDLAWNFRAFCDRYGLRTVFYEVAPSSLPLYLELGLSLVKLGEGARVSLERFSLQGNSAKSWRHAINAQEKAGSFFEVVPREEVPPLLPRLRAISDAWLSGKATREKGFSLGFFDEAYIARGPVALVRRDGEILAFANLWVGADREELSIDLMRFDERLAAGAMEYLILETMLWGKAQGFRSFDLGMAPLAGVGARPLGSWWSKVGAWLFRFGEHFYNFQGLRQFKEKFDPIWEPRYLAYPGGFSLPRVLIDVTVLTSGGLEGVVTR